MQTLTSIETVMGEMCRLSSVLVDDIVELRGLKVGAAAAEIEAKRAAIGALERASASLSDLQQRTRARDRRMLAQFGGTVPGTLKGC